MRIQQAVRSFLRRYRLTFDGCLFLILLIASLCVQVNIGPRSITIPIVFAAAAISFPLGFFRMWQRWQNHKAWVASREARLRADIAALQKPLGDPNCAHSARSPHIRCAVNPGGPCEGCPDFQKLSS
jgi:hypothetical protein